MFLALILACLGPQCFNIQLPGTFPSLSACQQALMWQAAQEAAKHDGWELRTMECVSVGGQNRSG
jgi:hypothetical protein